MYRIFLFPKTVDIAINLIISKVSPLTTGKVITDVNTTLFMYVCRSRSLLGRLAELCSGESSNGTLGEGGATVRESVSQKAGSCCRNLQNPFSRIYSTVS
jgi:hypothetical protein